MRSPELLFTIVDKGEAVSLVRACDADAAIHIAEQMLAFCRPDHETLQARTATSIESDRFFEDACAWSGEVALAGIVLNTPTATVH